MQESKNRDHRHLYYIILLAIPELQEEQGRDHGQNYLMQESQNCCFGEYDERSEGQQSVSMDMDLEETEPARCKWYKVYKYTSYTVNEYKVFFSFLSK